MHVTDLGGHCPGGEYAHGTCTAECDDKQNLVLFLKKVKELSPEIQISIAAAASPYIMEKAFDVPELDKVLHHWNLMSYDYYVADLKGASFTAPNQPMNAPKGD
jgi:GH18 family chitinase